MVAAWGAGASGVAAERLDRHNRRRPSHSRRADPALAAHPGARALLFYAAFNGGSLSGMEGIDWVIAGGESGPNARPSDPEWFRGVRDDCGRAGVPFLFKQWGEWADHHYLPDGATSLRVGRALMHRIGKHRAGRHLDGVLHDARPAA